MANQLKGAVCHLGDQTRHRIDMIPHFAPPINRIDQGWAEPLIPECSGNISYAHVNKAFDNLSDREPLPEEESRVGDLDPRGGGLNPVPACQGTVVSQPNYHVTGNVGEEVLGNGILQVATQLCLIQAI